MLRLSPDVYHGRHAAAVGVAAHEAGHALQYAKGYLPLALRNAAVPAAQFGPMLFIGLLILGFLLSSPKLILMGIIAYSGIVVFQVINLPVEFDASHRAKLLLNEHGIVDNLGADAVNSVLGAAAWTYVAGTLESVLTLAYYLLELGGLTGSEE